jgi:hypothetical protein
MVGKGLAATLARATQAHAVITTPGAKPVALADGTQSILIRDIDSRFVELRQAGTTAATAAQTTSSTSGCRLP